MFFSIITCTYNRKLKLERCIKSVLKQKFKSFEHFVVDDGSTDETAKLVKKKYKHIKYIKLSKNLGQPGAMFYSNVIKKTQGEFIILLDSDDYLKKNALQKIKKKINKNNVSKVWSYSFFLNYNDKSNKKFKTKEGLYNSNEFCLDHHPKIINGKGFLDTFNVRKKIFYSKFLNYFKSPKYWYLSQYEVYFKYKFKEKFLTDDICCVTYDKDSVTSGSNFFKYSPISFFTRKTLLKKYNKFFGKKYLNFSTFSYLTALSTQSNSKFFLIKELKRYKKSLTKFQTIIIYCIIFLPYRLNLYIKYFLKKIKSERY